MKMIDYIKDLLSIVLLFGIMFVMLHFAPILDRLIIDLK